MSSHFGPIVEFGRLSAHMKIRVLSKGDEARESLAFHRVVIALLRTNRDHEQKLVLTRYLHCSSRGKSLMGFLDLLKVSIVHCALKLPNP